MKFKLMINCDEAARLLSDQLERPLPWHKRLSLKIHVRMCKICRIYGQQIAALKDLLSRKKKFDFPPDRSTLSDDARQQIKSRLKDQM